MSRADWEKIGRQLEETVQQVCRASRDRRMMEMFGIPVVIDARCPPGQMCIVPHECMPQQIRETIPLVDSQDALRSFLIEMLHLIQELLGVNVSDDPLPPLPDTDLDESLLCCGCQWPTHGEYWAHRKATHTWEAPSVTETEHAHMPGQVLREEDDANL